MKENVTYIDFDGVILDSQQRMLERKMTLGFSDDKSGFKEFFTYADSHLEEWEYIINQAVSINESVEIIKELENVGKEIAILTKIHTLYEMKAKIYDLRKNRNIKCPVYFVPPGVDKNEIVIPNGHILVDDSSKNISLWNNHGGIGYLFDQYASNDSNDKVRSLAFLLRR